MRNAYELPPTASDECRQILTKREIFAIAALQGLLSNPGGPVQQSCHTGWNSTVNCTRGDVAGEAVQYADALIEALS